MNSRGMEKYMNDLSRVIPRFFFFVFSLAFAGAALAQTTVTLQNDDATYFGTTDAWISCCDAANMHFGLNNDMELRGELSDSGVIRFAIFQSDGGPVPNGATINSATLSLYMYGGVDAVFRASRLLRSFSEPDVTWNSPWSVPGAGAGNDYATGSMEEGSVAAPNGWLNINVTGSVGQFANGSAQNLGWKITQVSSSSEGSYKNFVSKDNNNTGLRPKLTVTYTTGPPPDCKAGNLRPFDQSPINGNPISVPSGGATFEAEHFDCGGPNNAYYDTVPGNAGNVYRTTEDVDLTTSSGANGYVVNNFQNTEWLKYTINVASPGSYTVGIRASNHLQNPATTAVFHVDVGSIDFGTISVPTTASWDDFAWYETSAVWLNAGQYDVKLRADQQYANVDELRLLPSSGGGGGDCSTPGLDLCVQFEAAPDTTFSGNNVWTQSVAGQLMWWAQNQNSDSATDTSRIAPVSISRDGASGIKLQTRESDDQVHSSYPWERSEIELDSGTNATEGADAWWANSLYIPTDSVLPTGPGTQISFFQFHGHVGSAPNFILGVFNQGGYTPHAVFRAFTAGGPQLDKSQYDSQVDGFYNMSGRCIFNSVRLGVWYDFVHHIHWASNGTGRHEIWMREDGGPVYKVLDKPNISTIYTGDSPFLKVGVYHDAVPGAFTSAIHDRLRRGTSANAVRMPDFPVDTAQAVTSCPGVTDR